MQYTTRTGERPSLVHVNYQCPCGCVAGLTYDRDSGAEHLGRCCCGRLLWVGGDAQERVLEAREPNEQYELDLGSVSLPWGETVLAALAVPVIQLRPHATSGAPHLVRDVVCNMRIEAETAAATSVYEGVTYYFCAPVCKQRFDANPLQFIAQEA